MKKKTIAAANTVEVLSLDKAAWAPGMQVAYVPNHANSLHHPDVEFGFITGMNIRQPDCVFVRYFRQGSSTELRTLSSSESTPVIYLIAHKHTNAETVDYWMRKLGYWKEDHTNS